MSLHGLAFFCLVYVLAWATPGPGTAAFVARVLSRGSHGLPAFIAGFVVGDLARFALAASGMAALAQTAHSLFAVVKYVGALYLLYLAFRMWTAPARPVSEEIKPDGGESPLKLFVGSFALVLGNPKAIVFFLALLPTVVDIDAMTIGGFAQIAVVMCVLLSGILTLYALAALRTRRFFQNVQAVRWLNRGSGTVMAGAAVAVATR